MSHHHVVLSGCSGGGKSTLLAELKERGFTVVPEPGRRIVEEEQHGDGLALPWIDLSAFAKRAIDLASQDRERLVDEVDWVFFDRGLVDAAVALEHATGTSAKHLLASYDRYHQSVFLTPPWPEIYVTDEQRQHNLDEAIAEYDRLLRAYRELRYDTVILPKVGVRDRADFVLRNIS